MLADCLRQTGFYSDEDVLLFEKAAVSRTMAKNEILLQQGAVCKSMFYNITGAFYQYNVKDEIEENIIDLHTDKEWFFNHSSFASQKPSGSFIKAYAQSSILELSVESLHWLIAKSQVFLQMGKLLDQATSRVYFFDNCLTPAEKYQYILDNRPQLIQQFPQKMLASYLKITPETLSRVRDKFSRGKVIS
jgi:CRP-like cAMP-binding protein